MEEVLDVYEQGYNPQRPVICFDERACQLIGDLLAPIPMEPGQVQRQDYHYKRNGTCVMMMAFEPLAGKRIVEVRERKTKKDYAKFMKKVEQAYPKAEKIILVQDNLNTHNPSSFYETFSPKSAFRLSQRFQMVYTPKKASWLNMSEIELSALSKQCLDRRIGDIKTFSKEVYACSEQRNRQKATVSWQFTKSDAREKFNKFYRNIKH
jgi:transposase